MKNPYDGMTLADMAVMFGPATCGCVPFEHSNIRETLTFAQMDKIKERRGWARCPICDGSGVDPRVEIFELEPMMGGQPPCR